MRADIIENTYKLKLHTTIENIYKNRSINWSILQILMSNIEYLYKVLMNSRNFLCIVYKYFYIYEYMLELYLLTTKIIFQKEARNKK